MTNHLKNETSPYLLQHAENPVDWYPWGEEAFKRAKAEDKPVFLSIGYSTCHWCHVMAHESFEDPQVAEILNAHFISVKVDREERPDIDSIYMSVCQAFTGSGGWPMSIFMTPEQKPFFAGSYFPKNAGRGMIGFHDLLEVVAEKWATNRAALVETGENVVAALKAEAKQQEETNSGTDEKRIDAAVLLFKRSFDKRYGGFGRAPKFPAPHNLLFLMQQYEKNGDETALAMAEKTLIQMYRGGIFDHIGYGFARYSTDERFLAPHFEKMLYDNALLILAYCQAYSLTKKPVYLGVAQKTAQYLLREMVSPDGGFYSAQDADSEGEEGKYYLFTPAEIQSLLGEEGEPFCKHYDITAHGNFAGKSIPNLLLNDHWEQEPFARLVPQVYAYRKGRTHLHLDNKILTAWNGLAIAAMAALYRVSGDQEYLDAAVRAERFLAENLSDGDTLFVSFRDGKRSGKGFLDDYAACSFALLSLYEATYEPAYFDRAQRLCQKALASFADETQGGFYLYGPDNEQLITRPKETYDGAMPCGNSLMAYNLVRLYLLTGKYGEEAERQLSFMSGAVRRYPTGSSFFLTALSDFLDPPEKITVVVKDREDLRGLPLRVPLRAAVTVLDEPNEEYRLINGRTTYYLCKNRSCLPPVNELE